MSVQQLLALKVFLSLKTVPSSKVYGCLLFLVYFPNKKY